MSWISFLRVARHRKIPIALTRSHNIESLRLNFHSLSVCCPSTLNLNKSVNVSSSFQSVNVSSSLCNVVLQRSASTSEPLTAKKSSSSIEVAVPDPPKRPLNAYNLFNKDNYDKAKDAIPAEDYQPKKVLASLGKMWRSLPESEAKMYKLKAEELSEKYKVAKATWEASLDPLQKEVLSHQKEEHSKALKEKKLKKVFKETEKPERVKRVLAIHFLDIGDDSVPGETAKEKFSRTSHKRSEMWNSLPENQREALKERASEQNKNAAVNYEKKLGSWVQKMFDDGMMDIVSKSDAKVALQQLEMPSRNRNALQLFMMSDLGKEKGVTVGTAKAIFDKLSSAQQEQFKQQAVGDKERFTREYQNWMTEMENMGLKSYADALLHKYRARAGSGKKKVPSEGKKRKAKGKKKAAKKTTKKSST